MKRSCRHGFATTMLRKGYDPKTAADLGGWDFVTLFMDTYAHAMPKARLTDSLFDTATNQTQQKKLSRKNKELK